MKENFYIIARAIKDIFKPFPEVIQINPNFQDENGNTAAMLFVKFRKKVPPLSLKHDPDIYNKNNKNIAMMTVERCLLLSKVPDWMIPSDLYKEDRIGETLAIKWVRHQRSEPPGNIRTDPNYQTRVGKQVLAVRWIAMVTEDVPIWMRCFPELQDNLLGTMANAWIVFHPYGDIPNYMKYSNDLISKDRTIAMKWIEVNKSEPQRWMRHSPNLVAGGETMASLYFNIYKVDVPNYMRHSPEIEVNNTTMAMKWITFKKSMPPRWMLHSPTIVKENRTMATTWIVYVKTEPPSCMKYSPELTLGGYTMAMTFVIHLNTDPPDSLKHDPSILSKDGLSLKKYWKHTTLPEWMKYEPFKKARIGCSHSGDKVLSTSDEIFCGDCGTGEKTFCFDICPICREEFEKDAEVSIFRFCKHVFCETCLVEWNRTHSLKCPCCNCNNE
jgi:hypothetical protein